MASHVGAVAPKESVKATTSSVREPWRLRQEELRVLVRNYVDGLAKDYKTVLEPTRLERYLMSHSRLERLAKIHASSVANHKLLEIFIEDLGRDCQALEGEPQSQSSLPKPLVQFADVPDADFLPAGHYGTIKILLLHLLRDWSEHSVDVVRSTYMPVLQALKDSGVPEGGDVLVPGCGLCRLAMEIAGVGYKVEANDASRLLVTASDWFLNRAPTMIQRMQFFPLAHIFEEHWDMNSQYLEAHLPVPLPSTITDVGEGDTPILFAPGDFTKLYTPGGCRHKKFDALVTCFFLDALVDIAEFVALVRCILHDGGVWINMGPLQFHPKAKLKLCWEEITGMFKRIGFEFQSQKVVQCDYILPQKQNSLFSESYCCILSVAIKRNCGSSLEDGLQSQMLG